MERDQTIKNFLEIPYSEMEELNLSAGKIKDQTIAEKTHREYLEEETRIKAITVCFSDIEGRLHMLDYDKKYLLNNAGNLTFDGSSIRGFTAQNESDLRLGLDWLSFRWLPSDIFGPGKVILFADVLKPNMEPYENDFRHRLKIYLQTLKKEQKLEAFMGPEIEGFLLDGIDAEQNYDPKVGFKLVTSGGYYHSLPLDKLRQFIDATAEAQRAMGFQNEKDHPEVAPSQFEINFHHTDALRACDQVQLYKLVCRQIANNLGFTATFLPKPIQNINGSGMHTNFSMKQDGKNIFYDKKGESNLSKFAWDFVDRLLYHAPELCLILNSSVNAYRRLDPHFEAPNQIKVTPNDRGSMVRIPAGDEKSARIEVRSVAPDANPYLTLFAIIKTGLEGEKTIKKQDQKKLRLRFLPGTINDAIRLYKASDFLTKILSQHSKERYLEPKEETADRNPKELGGTIKESEIVYHHEITNQYLWSQF